MRCEGREGLHRERHQVRRKRLLQHRSARRELLDGSDLWIERQQRIYRFRRFCRLVAFLRELPAQRRVGTPTQYDLLPALAHAFVGRRFLLQIQTAPTNPRARQMPLACEKRSRVSGVARMHGNAWSPVRPRLVACAPLPGRMNDNAGLYARPRQGGFNFWALQRHTRKYHSEDRKKTAGRWLAFSHFRARYSATPQSSAQKLKACSACFSQEAFRALSRTI